MQNVLQTIIRVLSKCISGTSSPMLYLSKHRIVKEVSSYMPGTNITMLLILGFEMH